MPFGWHDEEFEVGAVDEHRPGKTVTADDDHLFRPLTTNHPPLHVDAHDAEETTDVPPRRARPDTVDVEQRPRRRVRRDRGQAGTVVCTFRRKAMMSRRSYGDARVGEQPGRPVPVALPGRACHCASVVTRSATSGSAARSASAHQRASVASSPGVRTPASTVAR